MSIKNQILLLIVLCILAVLYWKQTWDFDNYQERRECTKILDYKICNDIYNNNK